MKMGEMPSFHSGESSKDYKRFETPKTQAQKEAEERAKDLEGGAQADNPGSGGSASDDYFAFLDDLLTKNQSANNNANFDQGSKELNIKLPGAKKRKLNNPEEELALIKSEIEEFVNTHGKPTVDSKELERIAGKTINEYALAKKEDLLSNTYAIKEKDIIREILKLEPEEHDDKIEALLKMIPHKGVKNVLTIVKRMNNPHLEDDFHKALVQYILNSLPAPQLKEGTALYKELSMVLYEVKLGKENPTESDEGLKQQKVRELERLIRTMEQFYAGMLSVAGKDNYFAIEIAKPIGQEHVSFFVALPASKKSLFEKHLLSVYPDSKLTLKKDDYNVFNYKGYHVGAYASLAKHYSASLKTARDFSYDPMNVILGAFSDLDKFQEGASIQFIIGDEGDTPNTIVQKVITNLKDNKPFGKAVRWAESPAAIAKDEIKKHFKELIFGEDKTKPKPPDERLIEQISIKYGSRIVPCNIRVFASSDQSWRSNHILNIIQSAFNQFENPGINSIKWKAPKDLRQEMEDFIYRRFNPKEKVMLSILELSTMLHLTAAGIGSSRELQKANFKQNAAPIEVSEAASDLAAGRKKGIVLGKNQHGAKETLVPFLEDDRMRHYYVIGQTGTGKTYLLKSMIIQDIKNGDGVCYIDPHGNDIVDILAAIPPERADDLIYFDPSYTKRPYGLNILEWNADRPEEKTFVTNELYEIFVKLFGDVPESLGPMFQQYYRNATLLALEGQEPGEATMADIPKVFADREFRHKLLEKSKNPIVNQFWIDIAEKAKGDPSLENVTPYITAKTDTFLANDIIRPIVAQRKTTIDFRKIMDERKILLVNLSKGRIGELNAQLLGLIIVGKFLQAALARVESLDLKALAPFYLYIDEFQNFTTPSIATILSEARKYRLSLNLAHQFIKQLDEKIRDAVFGNVGTKTVFRVSPEDAEFLEKSFVPEFTAKDLMSIENYNAYISLLINGTPVKPFSMQTITYDWNLNFEYAEKLKQLSFLKYGRPREEVEQEIFERYMPKNPPAQEQTPPPFPWM